MLALCVKLSLHQGSCIVRVLCVFWGSQQCKGNICTQWHRPSAFTHGSCRATLHGLAGCDLPEAPGELFLLKASCASYFLPAKYSTVQLFTWEAWSTAPLLSPFYIFGVPLCKSKRARRVSSSLTVKATHLASNYLFQHCTGDISLK